LMYFIFKRIVKRFDYSNFGSRETLVQRYIFYIFCLNRFIAM